MHPIDAPVGTSRVQIGSRSVNLKSFSCMNSCKHAWLSGLLVLLQSREEQQYGYDSMQELAVVAQ